MAKVLQIVNLTMGTSSNVSLGSNPDQIQAIRIANESPYALIVTTPDNSVYWLPAWMEDIIAVQNGNILTVLPQTLPGTPSVGYASTACLITIYDKGDKVPAGSWPIALARQVNVGNALQLSNQAQLFTASSNGGSGTSIGIGLVPSPGQNTYVTGFTVTVASGVAANYKMTIVGLSTLLSNPTFYFQTTTTAGVYVSERFPYAIPSTVGTQVTLNFSTTVSSNASLNVYGYFL